MTVHTGRFHISVHVPTQCLHDRLCIVGRLPRLPFVRRGDGGPLTPVTVTVKVVADNTCPNPATLIDLSSYLVFVVASAAVIIVPGPTVTVIIANSLRSGAGAGLMNVAGTQVGLALLIAVVATGLTTIISTAGALFDIVRFLGAAYLVWLGIKLWCADGTLGDLGDRRADKGRSDFFWQGVLVILSNPKALLFVGAFLPQFVNPRVDAAPQILLLGVTFMVIGALLDSVYALAAGKTGSSLSKNNIRLLERVSGTCLVGGGLWLALIRQ